MSDCPSCNGTGSVCDNCGDGLGRRVTDCTRCGGEFCSHDCFTDHNFDEHGIEEEN